MAKSKVTNVQLYTENNHYVSIARDSIHARHYTNSSTKSRDRLIHALQRADFHFTPFYDGWGAFLPY